MVDQQHDTLFLGYIEGDLTPEQIQEFENILVQDARLRNLVAQLVIDRSRLRRLPREDAPSELMDRVNQQIERRMLLNGSLNAPAGPGRMSPERRFQLNRFVAYAGLAAMVAITAMVVVWTLSYKPVLELAQKQRRPPTLAESQAKIEGGQMADARGGNSATPLQRDRQLDEVEPRPREVAGPLATAPRPAARASGPESEVNANLAALAKGKTETDSAQKGLSRPPAAAPALNDRALFSDDKKPSPAATAAPVAETADASGKSDAQTGLAGKDRPVPVGQPGTAAVYESSVRLEVASAWPDVSRREVLAWANRHNAQVVTRQNEPADEPIADEIEKAIHDKSAPTPSSERTVVLMVANKQVPDLVMFLNTQKGQSATLTQPVAVGGTALAAQAERSEWKNETETGSARGERAATQPTTSPADIGAAKNGAVNEGKIGEEQEQVKRVKVPAEIVVLPNAPDAVMRLEVVIEPRGADR